MERSKKSFIAANSLDDDMKLIVSRASDMTELCEKRFSPVFSEFLTEGEAACAEKFLRYICCERYRFFGGYEGAQRVVLCVFPEYCEPEDGEYPIRLVRFDSRAAGGLTHRDYLGSLMGMGITRNRTGDIICDENGAYAFLSPAAADMALSGIEKIGRVGVKARAADGEAVSRNDKFSIITASAASLRLDCIVAAAVKVSREKAAILIRSGAVSVNHGVIESVSENVPEGAVLSVRGEGRFILSEVGGVTKKNRYHITIKKYI